MMNMMTGAVAKDACGGYEKLKADIAEKEKMLAEIKQEQAAAISDLERGIKKEMYTECKREYDKQSTQLRIMELALSRVSDSDARVAVRQFYFERKVCRRSRIMSAIPGRPLCLGVPMPGSRWMKKPPCRSRLYMPVSVCWQSPLRHCRCISTG